MNDSLVRAVKLLQSGELVAFPTETVYGLGADATNLQAVAKIFAAKGRPANHPLIVHLPGTDYLEGWAEDVPDTAQRLARAFWPGPLTLILKRGRNVPYSVTGGQETIGIRVPSHPLALLLLNTYAKACADKGSMCGIAAPSANRFGRISPTTAQHVRTELGDQVALILDGGPCVVGIESTIIDLSRGTLSPPRLLRPGRISPDEIAKVIGVFPENALSPQDNRGAMRQSDQVGDKSPDDDIAPRVSGSMAGHYAPLTPLFIILNEQLQIFLRSMHESGQRCALLTYSHFVEHFLSHAFCRLPDNPEGYAQGLYAALRRLDEANSDAILVEAVPETSEWMAIADRLRRAAYGSSEGMSSSSELG